jgi:hypothetical protein
MQNYETDVIAWANEQAAFIRSGRFDLLDLEHIADEIEDVGKSEQRELMSHLTGLIAHLLKWKFQPSHRGSSWEKTIKVKRKEIAYSLKSMPSLKTLLVDPEWLELVWDKAVNQAMTETELDGFPESFCWSVEQILNSEFWPE